MSAERLTTNFRAVQAAAGSAFETVAVIKADAYGHGAALCALVLVNAGAGWLGVTDLEEGLRVRSALAEAGAAGQGTRVLVMSGFEPEDAAGIVAADLTTVVWTPEHIGNLEQAAAQAGRRVKVHLEIDSGMSRQGAAPGAELDVVLKRLFECSWVRLEGVFSHLSSSEIVDSAETARQECRFGEGLRQLFEEPTQQPGYVHSDYVHLEYVHLEYVHLGNSSAVDEGSSLGWLRDATGGTKQRMMVRTGLALYGYVLPMREFGSISSGESFGSEFEVSGFLRKHLQPVATWKTRVIGVREVAAGNTVGYGATFVAARPMRLALLPVGYADGLRREASSGVGDGWVMIGGQRAAVVGRVSMNLTVVDTTEFAPAVGVGDEVVLLGEGVTAEDHARWCGTIPYEILCGMRGHRRLV